MVRKIIDYHYYDELYTLSPKLYFYKKCTIKKYAIIKTYNYLLTTW